MIRYPVFLFKKLIIFQAEHGWKASLVKVSNFLSNMDWWVFYNRWYRKNYSINDSDILDIKKHLSALNYKPLISILMPTYNTPKIFLEYAIESVRKQIYENWELCIVDDASTENEVRDVLKYYSELDARIKLKFRKENGHISKATNSALEIASGEFIALLDHDDELVQTALYYVIVELNNYPNAKMIYSDEDKLVDGDKLANPYFKPNWKPDLLLSHNYISHFGVYNTTIARDIDGFRVGFEGSQDYDFTLRFVEKICNKDIRHIPVVLYHWRSIEGSTAFGMSEKKYAAFAAREAINKRLERLNIVADVSFTNNEKTSMTVKYHYNPKDIKLSVLMVIDQISDLTLNSIESVMTEVNSNNWELLLAIDSKVNDTRINNIVSDYKNCSILLFHNLDKYYDVLNKLVSNSSGDIISIITTDIISGSNSWLAELVSYAYREEVGIVGPKIIDDNNYIYSAGKIFNTEAGLIDLYKGNHKSDIGYMGHAALVQNYSILCEKIIVLRKKVIEQIKGIRDDYISPAYTITDLCMQVEEAGYANVYNPNSIVICKINEKKSVYRTDELYDDKSKFERYWCSAMEKNQMLNPNLEIRDGRIRLAKKLKTVAPWKL